MENQEPPFFLAAYYLLRPEAIVASSNRKNHCLSCSNCLSEHLLYYWSYHWVENRDEYATDAKSSFGITDSNLIEIRDWVDVALQKRKIGWPNVFHDIESAKEYRALFFSHLSDVGIYALYVDGIGREEILECFAPRSEKEGEIGIWRSLLEAKPEKSGEDFLGYDCIEIEIDGGFHSFQCHNFNHELADEFGQQLNAHGLFDCWESARMLQSRWNSDGDFRRGPWMLAKTKHVPEDGLSDENPC